MNQSDSEAMAYLLSRAYGQGWAHAKKLISAGKAVTGASDGANPHLSEKERSRWMSGFADAVASHAGRSAKGAVRSSWPAARSKRAFGAA